MRYPALERIEAERREEIRRGMVLAAQLDGPIGRIEERQQVKWDGVIATERRWVPESPYLTATDWR